MIKKRYQYSVIAVIFLGGVFVGSGYLVNAHSQNNVRSHYWKGITHSSDSNFHSGSYDHDGSNKKWSHNKQDYGNFESIDRQTTLINNGVIIQITSTDDEIVDKIQQFGSKTGDHSTQKNGLFSDVSRDVELIDGGVKITVTSDDPDTVQLLQEKSTSEKKFGGRHRFGNHK